MGVATDAELLARAIKNPGRLILGPTSVTGSFPYGGTSLGHHRDGEIQWHAEYIPTRDPASGMMSEIGRAGAEYPEIYCLIEGPNWDEDVVFATFKGAVRVAAPEPAETRAQGSRTTVIVPAWPPLLLASEDPSLKSIYIPRPIPTLSLRAGVALSRMFHAGLPMRFTPTINSDYATTPPWQCARLENIVL